MPRTSTNVLASRMDISPSPPLTVIRNGLLSREFAKGKGGRPLGRPSQRAIELQLDRLPDDAPERQPEGDQAHCNEHGDPQREAGERQDAVPGCLKGAEDAACRAGLAGSSGGAEDTALGGRACGRSALGRAGDGDRSGVTGGGVSVSVAVAVPVAVPRESRARERGDAEDEQDPARQGRNAFRHLVLSSSRTTVREGAYGERRANKSYG